MKYPNLSLCYCVCFPGLLDHVTVLIGVAVKGTGKAIAGVIYQPFYNYQAGPEATRGRAIWGMIGLGKVTLGVSSL